MRPCAKTVSLCTAEVTGTRLALAANLDLDGHWIARDGGAARVLDDAHQPRFGGRRLVPLAAEPPVLRINVHLAITLDTGYTIQ